MHSNQQILSMIARAIYTVVLLTVILGIVYPLVITQVANVLFQDKAQGSLVYNQEQKVIGSSLISQDFSQTAFFKARPSAVSYDAGTSGGSNFGPSNPKLKAQIAERQDFWLKERARVNATQENVPMDLLTASSSGLDPHISVEAALFQVPIVAYDLKIDEAKLKSLIDAQEIKPMFGSKPYINVLELNVAVQALIAENNSTNTAQ